MSLRAIDDADVFLSDFAVTVDINGSEITGILDNLPAESSFVDSLDPIFTCKTSDLSSIKKGDVLTDLFSGKKYNIVKIPPDDGTGFTTIELETQ